MFKFVRQKFVPLARLSSSTGAKTNPPASLLELRVGRIIDVQKHESADKLYVSKIQLNEEQSPKIVQVCSGLVDYMSMNSLLDSRVCVAANLKKAKLRGAVSEAMVLAASDANDTKVELVVPPNSVPLGTLLYFKNHKPTDPFKTLNTKQRDRILDNLYTNSNREVFYGDDTSSILINEHNEDPCTVETLASSKVR
ncbi:hypothetical protein OGAPHI_000448 [Ogataea philodendri]|uniref:tRNA-binding domain-containing protein n=1 Tax=Ogataea philodendri TaxID=1378263 RepID=A0A9P8PGA4_9ASCO|nr:uncharacterized protein OGAPHI_000448 [Ogataea philodendri]KAH3671743.1 hypothetical protein OGAPHI_000448 [Ogataea philodendri]